jgi:hypothetical protein
VPLPAIITFKEHSLNTEWLSTLLSKRLKFILYSLTAFAYIEFGKVVELTCIFRTQEQQDIYRAKAPSEPEFSPHTYWRAIDISIKYFTENEINEILDYINSSVDYGDGEHLTAKRHNIGLGDHIHLQVSFDITHLKE